KPVGWNENLVTKMSRAADESYFINDQAEYLKTPLDEELIPQLSKVLEKREQKTFVVIHLLGTHNYYSKRFPDSFPYFTGKAPLAVSLNENDHETINAYDNAVRYNDWVLDK